MTDLLIRSLDEVLHARLKASAASHHRSLEEEAKELLRAAIARDTMPPRESLIAVAGRLFGSAGGVDLELPPRTRGPERDPPDFSGPEYGPSTDQ